MLLFTQQKQGCLKNWPQCYSLQAARTTLFNKKLHVAVVETKQTAQKDLSVRVCSLYT